MNDEIYSRSVNSNPDVAVVTKVKFVSAEHKNTDEFDRLDAIAERLLQASQGTSDEPATK